jgi:ABC-type multidrug transport system permease subunit
MRNFKNIWFIALKDLKIFAADRLALFFAILFPFFFVTMFYFLLGGVGSTDTRLELHMVTQETEGLSTQIIQAMVTKDDALLKPGEPKIVWDKDYNTALQSVNDKKLDGFLAFPSDFTEGIYLGYGTQIDIVVNAEATGTRAALGSIAQGIASQINAQQAATNATMGLVIEQQIASGNMSNIGQSIQNILPQLLAGQTGTGDNSSSFITYNIQNIGSVQAENPSNFVIPGYLVMFVFFTAALGAEMIVRERKNQTLERILASSVRKEAILGGIFVGTAIKGIIQLVIFWAMGILVFGMNAGESVWGVILLSLLMVIMSSAFSIMLATLVKTQRAASSIGVLTSLILAPLGGCWWPLFITPAWMQFLAKFTPHGWATLGFNKLMVSGADFNAIIPNLLVLLGFAIAFGLIATLRFRTSPT